MIPDTSQTVVEAVARACHLDARAVSADTSVQDLGLDSMSLISVFSEIEAVYNVTFTAEQLIEMLQAATVSDLISSVRTMTQNCMAPLSEQTA